jgi:hypothetical protein
MKALVLVGLILLFARHKKAAAKDNPEADEPPDDSTPLASGAAFGNPLLPMPEEFQPLLFEPPTPYDPMHDWNAFDQTQSPLPIWGGDIPLLPPDRITQDQYNAAMANVDNLLSQLPGGIRQKVSNIQHLASFHRRLFHKVFG